MQSGQGPDRFIGVQAADGYDAARILLPELCGFILSHLGEPFFAGIPNRDFLICWAADCSEQFHAFAREKIAGDYEVQSYPLTPSVIVATAEKIVPEIGR
jgi:hypothetical protein